MTDDTIQAAVEQDNIDPNAGTMADVLVAKPQEHILADDFHSLEHAAGKLGYDLVKKV